METILYAALVLAVFLVMGVAVKRVIKSKPKLPGVKIPFDQYKDRERSRK